MLVGILEIEVASDLGLGGGYPQVPPPPIIIVYSQFTIISSKKATVIDIFNGKFDKKKLTVYSSPLMHML